LRDCDAAVLATAWPDYLTLDWNRMGGVMGRRIVCDARGGLAAVAMPAGFRIVRVGTRETLSVG
jgi:hypothetical protein